MWLFLLAGCDPSACPPDGDAGTRDAGEVDAGARDAGVRDAGVRDAEPVDAGGPARFTLTFTVRRNPAIDAFDTVEGREVVCEIGVPSMVESGSPPRTVFESAVASVRCTPDPPDVVGRMARNLDGEPATLIVSGTATSPVNPVRFEIAGAGGAEIFRLENRCDSTDFPDDGARPVLGPFRCAGGTLSLERYAGIVSPGTLTDQGTADSRIVYEAP